MTPVTFSGCFGWLHPGDSAIGVVLCGTFGHEDMNAHRGWRHLAELLATRGFHVLRFDYPGTGDSTGSDRDPGRLAAWQDSIAKAAAFLRSVTPTEQVILIGLRLGAALALRASRAIDQVAGVACLAPVLSGKSYVRELRLLANAWREANFLTVPGHCGDALEVVGDRLTEATLSDIAAIDLRSPPLAASPVLLMQEGPSPHTDGFAAGLAAQGRVVSRLGFPGAAAILQDSFSSAIPREAFVQVAEWCVQFLNAAPPAAHARPNQATAGVLRLASASETALRFGQAHGLFGILCAPRIGARPDAPTVVMLNTGFGRHIGDGRMFVLLARRLAAMGVASLRMDLSGFGDSAAAEQTDLDPYLGNTSVDIASALDALQRMGHVNPLLVGVCSGAYAAFHGALADQRIRGLILVNLQAFIWHPGSSLAVRNKRKRRPLQFYLRAILQRGTWRRLRGGDVAFGAVLAALLRRPLLRAYDACCLLLEASTGLKTRSGQVMRWVRALNSREVMIRLLYSDGDPGLSELARRLPRNRLRRLACVKVDTIPQADHALLDGSARLRLIETVCRAVKEACNTAGHQDAA